MLPLRHCQVFAQRYVELAQEMMRRNIDQSTEVEFHAISCSAYHWVCKDHAITGFPTVIAYKAKSEGTKITRFTAEVMAEAVGVTLNAIPKNHYVYEENSVDHIHTVDILGASAHVYHRDKKETYADAALSFTQALRSEIFRNSDNDDKSTLSVVKKDAISEWIDLLFWTLPPTWMLHTLINDLRNNFDSILQNHQNLTRIIDLHNDIIHISPHIEWSSSCSHERDGEGYTCGLWNLLHILSIGVAERHAAVLGSTERVSVHYAAETLRNYMEHFFGCAVCTSHFLHLYDVCAFKRCKRFKKKVKDVDDWKELALWVWEVHNDVNDFKDEQINEIDNSKTLLWPKKEDCVECWKDDGKWDKRAVYEHLRQEYWPAGVQNFRYVVLDKKSHDPDESQISLRHAVFWTSTFLLIFLVMTWVINRRNYTRSGVHKKFDF